MLIVSLSMGQTALTESWRFSVGWGVASITLTCLSGAILSGMYEPEAIPDEELSPLASRIIIAMLITVLIVLLLPLSV
jgi:hypothetical protein